jgi:hypothetical protein
MYNGKIDTNVCHVTNYSVYCKKMFDIFTYITELQEINKFEMTS